MEEQQLEICVKQCIKQLIQESLFYFFYMNKGENYNLSVGNFWFYKYMQMRHNDDNFFYFKILN